MEQLTNAIASSSSNELVMHVILIALTILPSFWLGFYVYRKDVVEKEPFLLLVSLFFHGILAVIPVLILSFLFEIIFGVDVPLLFETFIEIGFVEEGVKRYYVKKLTWNNKEFNYIYDAIVYAVFVALGFATFENFLYVFQSESPIIISFFTAIIRAIASVPGHAFFAVFMGYYLGLAKLAEYNGKNGLKRKYLILSFMIPALCHGFFDFCLMTQNSLFIIFFTIFVLFLYIMAFIKVREHSNVLSAFPNNKVDIIPVELPQSNMGLKEPNTFQMSSNNIVVGGDIHEAVENQNKQIIL